jgi:Protein of unknown function (DUF3237)
VIELRYEMTFTERIEGPLGPTTSGRLCWQIAEATLTGPRIEAALALPGTDWIHVDDEGIRRPDQRAQFLTADGTLILLHYDTGLIRGDQNFLDALAHGRETAFADQYMCMAPRFEVSGDGYGWLTRSLFVARGRLTGPRRIEYSIHRVM